MFASQSQHKYKIIFFFSGETKDSVIFPFFFVCVCVCVCARARVCCVCVCCVCRTTEAQPPKETVILNNFKAETSVCDNFTSPVVFVIIMITYIMIINIVYLFFSFKAETSICDTFTSPVLG